MLELEYEMTFAERIAGPLGATLGSPPRLAWTIAEATLTGERITASLAAPGADWIRLGADGIRRQDQRTSFLTADGSLILMSYQVALIRGGESFVQALESGQGTSFTDQYMCMAPQFEVSSDEYAWLTRSLFIGRGRLAGPRRIEYEIHRVAG
ncbi:MAG TPA: DUF3237 domain-containing protein [Streptosporangiaceae bacterium]|nr:DUF3237 domain-containing protein [Streptosporangiaceae bacterium]